MADVLIVNPPSPDGHIYIRDMCRWGRKSREKIPPVLLITMICPERTSNGR